MFASLFPLSLPFNYCCDCDYLWFRLFIDSIISLCSCSAHLLFDIKLELIFLLLGSKRSRVFYTHIELSDNMPICPFICLACFVCPRLAFFVSMFFACICIEHGHLEQGCDLLGLSKKGKETRKKMQAHQGAMFSRLGGLAPPERFSLSLSLSLFSIACVRVPPLLVPFYFSYSLLRLRSLGMAMFVLHFLYLAGPYL